MPVPPHKPLPPHSAHPNSQEAHGELPFVVDSHDKVPNLPLFLEVLLAVLPVDDAPVPRVVVQLLLLLRRIGQLHRLPHVETGAVALGVAAAFRRDDHLVTECPVAARRNARRAAASSTGPRRHYAVHAGPDSTVGGGHASSVHLTAVAAFEPRLRGGGGKGHGHDGFFGGAAWRTMVRRRVVGRRRGSGRTRYVVVFWGRWGFPHVGGIKGAGTRWRSKV